MSVDDRLLTLSLIVAILKQRLARQVLAFAHRHRQPRLFDLDRLKDAALAAKREVQLACRGSSRADPAASSSHATCACARTLRCRCGCRCAPAVRRRWRARVGGSTPGPSGRGACGAGSRGSTSANASMRWYLVESRSPRQLRVIAILLAARRIAAGRLQMRARVGGDPDVGPRRRQHQRANARQRLRVADQPAVRIDDRRNSYLGCLRVMPGCSALA